MATKKNSKHGKRGKERGRERERERKVKGNTQFTVSITGCVGDEMERIRESDTRGRDTVSATFYVRR
jgi:hypothetical protein